MQTEVMEIQRLSPGPWSCGRCGRTNADSTVTLKFLCCGMDYSTWWCAECLEVVGSVITFPSEVHYTAQGGHTVFLLISQADQEAGKEEVLLIEALAQDVEPTISERIDGLPRRLSYPTPNDIAVVRCNGESQHR